ncbi:hypothetical protein [Deinococcus depolymerans]|uniref:Uncharacterized protein n=1 Tax=Deinococcus depolymerans TaxID=392408 RepID=A0ABP3MRE0_9DEIO
MNPAGSTRSDRYWTPEEDRLLALMAAPELEDVQDVLLRRSEEAVRYRRKAVKGQLAAVLSYEEACLCYWWSQLRSPRTPLQWVRGDPLPVDVWSPGGAAHIVVVGESDLRDDGHRRIVAGAAQVDLIAAASSRLDVEVMVVNGTRAWDEQVRRGVRSLLGSSRLPNGLLKVPAAVRASAVLAVGPRGMNVRQLDLLPPGTGVIAVMVQSPGLDAQLRLWEAVRTVRTFRVEHLNSMDAACPVTWADVPYLPDDGRVTAATPDVAVRFAYAYAKRHQRLPRSATPEVDSLLGGRREGLGQGIVGRMVSHFQSLLTPYVGRDRGALTLDVGRWEDERVTIPVGNDPMREKAGLS